MLRVCSSFDFLIIKVFFDTNTPPAPTKKMCQKSIIDRVVVSFSLKIVFSSSHKPLLFFFSFVFFVFSTPRNAFGLLLFDNQVFSFFSSSSNQSSFVLSSSTQQRNTTTTFHISFFFRLCRTTSHATKKPLLKNTHRKNTTTTHQSRGGGGINKKKRRSGDASIRASSSSTIGGEDVRDTDDDRPRPRVRREHELGEQIRG